MIITETYFAISRAVDAPRERIFRAWIDPALRARWYGPEALPFRELDPPARLVFALDEDEETAVAIVTLADEGDHTVMTFEGSAPAAEAEAVEQSWGAILESLAELVAQGSQSGGNAGGMRPG
jgi:uncharacterized protein YndB with AHSA1/START domain